MKQLDILAIGDVVIDAFIRLQDAEVHCDIDNTNCKLSMDFGQKIPYESVTICNAVGNASNAAVSASRLGLASGLLSYIGNDQNGKDVIAELQKNKVDTTLVHTVDGAKTNYHYVLWYDVDRTILVKHEVFDYRLGDVTPPKWIYLSSLGEKSFDMYEQIHQYLLKNPEVKLAFQPGVFDMKQGKEKLSFIYERASAVCINVEEAQHILGEKSRDLKILLKKMAELGPKAVLITDGIDGAYAYHPEVSEDMWFMPVYPHKPFERTGAGDAFFSTIVSALALGRTIEEAITWGPINSMSVVQKIGAQEGLLTIAQLQNYLGQSPANYKPVKL